MSTPQQRIAAGYVENDAGNKRQDARLGAAHRHNDEYERYAALLESDRDRFDQLPQTTRLAVGHYLKAKAAAERTGQA